MVSTTEHNLVASEVHASTNKQRKLVYEPLDSLHDGIRLLNLLPHTPGEDSSVIRCQLSSVLFADKPKYEALSYVWDTSEDEGYIKDAKWISVNDVSISVTENLYDALRNLRQERPRLIWVDALSIDQENHQERQQQVGMMDYIYSRAFQVLTWLGVPRFTAESGVVVPELEYLPPYSGTMLKWICNNRYWTRLWIIQEVALARRVMVCIANMSHTWEDFIQNISDEYIFQQEGHLIMALRRKMSDRHGISNRLETLLRDFQHANCSEPRDKIYGFLGLAHDTLDGSIQVDYDIPLHELYRVVLKFFYSRQWIPDASQVCIDRAENLVAFSHLLQRLFPKIEIPEQESLNHDNIFTVTGLAACKIVELGPTYQDMISSSAANKLWRRSLERHYSSPDDIYAMREINEHFSYLLLDQDVSQVLKNVGQINPSRFYSNAIKNGSEAISSVIKNFSDQAISWDFGFPEYDLDNVERKLQDHPKEESPSPSPRMFLGENRFLGLAPDCARVGDIMCLFQNTSIAALLRIDKRHFTQTSHYRVVGKVYPSTIPKEVVSTLFLQSYTPMSKFEKVIIQMDIKTLATLTC